MGINQSLARRSTPPSALHSDSGEQPVVIIVDDDAAIREALSDLLSSAGYETLCFGTTRGFLEAEAVDGPGCVILDVRMPGASGLDLQRQMAQSDGAKPVIFLTGHGDIPMTVQAMKAGAVDFLTKPVRDQTLLDAVAAALAKDATQRSEAAIARHNTRQFETLTRREREVFQLVALGRVNKQIAFELGISEVTVKLHRSNVMRKMEAGSIGDLIRFWQTLPASRRL
jgi:FixJ family two-component response regulator